MQRVKDELAGQAAAIRAEKQRAESELQAAQPALEAAIHALETIKQEDISTLKKLGNPPPRGPLGRGGQRGCWLTSVKEFISFLAHMSPSNKNKIWWNTGMVGVSIRACFCTAAAIAFEDPQNYCHQAHTTNKRM